MSADERYERAKKHPCLCGAAQGEDCRSSSGKPVPGGHASRWRTADGTADPAPEPRPQKKDDRASKLKLALWYVEKIGGLDDARRYLNAIEYALRETRA